jgi:hypothetical protein
VVSASGRLDLFALGIDGFLVLRRRGLYRIVFLQGQKENC